MASRVNVKLLVVLGMSLFLAAGAVGAVYYLQVMRDPVRFMSLGDAAAAEGNYREARLNYGKALKREPTNQQYYDKVLDAVLRIRPQTRSEADELYTFYVGVLRHGTGYWPADASRHLKLIEELYSVSRLTGDANRWDMTEAAANEMLDRISPNDPARNTGLMYRGVSRVFQNSTPKEVEEGVEDLRVVVLNDPQNDLAQAAMVFHHLQQFEAFRFDGAERSAREALVAAATRVQSASETGAGPETARMALHVKLAERQWGRSSVSDDELLSAAADLMRSISQAPTEWILREVASTFQVMSTMFTRDKAAVLTQPLIAEFHRFLEEHPDNQNLRLTLANLYVFLGEMNKALALADEIIKAETMTVGLLARSQFEFRQEAAALQAGVAFEKWRAAAMAGSADARRHVAEIEAARDKLVTLVDSPARSMQCARADGMLAYARGRYDVAVGHFERLLKEFDGQLRGRGLLIHTLLLSAKCLEQMGQTGNALERLEDAMREMPNSPDLAVERARLLFAQQKFDEAEAALKEILRLMPDNEQARQLQVAFANQRAVRVGDASLADPVVAEVIKAQQAMSEGDRERTRGILVAATQQFETDVRIWLAATRFFMTVEEREEARRCLDRAAALVPDHPDVRMLDIVMRNDSPVDQMLEALRASYSDEAELAPQIVIGSERTAMQYEDRLQQLRARAVPQDAQEKQKLDEAIARTERILNQARQVLAEYRPKAEALNPNSPALLEHRFIEAVARQDWSAAQAVVTRAKEQNLDQVNGRFYEGRLNLARGEFRRAAEVLEEAVAIRDFSAIGWRGLGVAYRELGELRASERAFERAYQANPADPEVIKAYADVLLLRDNQAQALLLAREARRLQPYDTRVREVWLRLEASNGDKAAAMKERRQIFADEPTNVENAVQLLGMLGNAEPSREWILDDTGQPRFSDVRWAQMTPTQQQGALTNLRKAWEAESAKLLDAVRAELGDSLEFAVVKSSQLRSMGRVADGLEVVRSFVQKTPEPSRTLDMLLALAEYEANMGLADQALATLGQAKPADDAQAITLDAAIGRLYVSQDRLEEALPHFRRVAAKQDDRESKLRVVELLTNLERYEEAGEQLRAIIGRNKADYVETVLMARVSEGLGYQLHQAGRTREAQAKFGEFRDLLDTAEKLDPTNVETQIRWADFLLRRYDQTAERELLDEALKVSTRAEEMRAGTIQVPLIRANVYQRLGDAERAVNELERALGRAPAATSVRRLLVELLIQDGQFDRAANLIAEAIERNPTIADWYDRLGDVNLKKRDIVAARQAFEQAYALDGSVKQLVKLVESCLVGSPPDEARALALLREHADQFQAHPLLQIHYAQGLRLGDKRDDAMEQMKQSFATLTERSAASSAMPAEWRAWFLTIPAMYEARHAEEVERLVGELSNGSPSAASLFWLGRLWGNSADSSSLAHAVELLSQAIERWPESWRAELHQLYLDLGGLQYRLSQVSDAVASFERAVELKADNAEAMNNVAYLLVTEEQDPVKALRYAQRAAELRPGDAAILDTLGWVYFKLREFEDARVHLQRSLDRRETMDAHLHMVQVCIEINECDRARSHLRRAESMAATDATKAQVRDIQNLLEDRCGG